MRPAWLTRRRAIATLAGAAVIIVAVVVCLPFFSPDYRIQRLVSQLRVPATERVSQTPAGGAKTGTPVTYLVPRQSDVERRDRASKELVKIGKPAVGPLVAALRESVIKSRSSTAWHELLRSLGRAREPLDTYAIIETLVGIGDDAAPALRALVDEGDSITVYLAVSALSRMKGPQTETVWLHLLTSSEPYYRRSAIGWFQGTGDTRAVPALAAMLKGTDTESVCAAMALQVIGEPQADAAMAAYAERIGLDAKAASYMDIVEDKESADWQLLPLILERYGTDEMAMGYLGANSLELETPVSRWATRHGREKVLAASAEKENERQAQERELVKKDRGAEQ